MRPSQTCLTSSTSTRFHGRRPHHPRLRRPRTPAHPRIWGRRRTNCSTRCDELSCELTGLFQNLDIARVALHHDRHPAANWRTLNGGEARTRHIVKYDSRPAFALRSCKGEIAEAQITRMPDIQP